MVSTTDIRLKRMPILRIAATHGATNVRVFGSSVRGEAGSGSDLDFLIELAPDRSLLDHVGLVQDLEELLQCRVDVVVEGGISPYLTEEILSEAVAL